MVATDASQGSAQLLCRVGCRLFGRRWKASLAKSIGIHSRTIQRWAGNEWGGPIWLIRRLPELIRSEAAASRTRAEDLEGFAVLIENEIGLALRQRNDGPVAQPQWCGRADQGER